MLQFIIENLQPILMALNALLGAIIGILLIIPGEQGETFLGRIKSFIGQFIKS
jgi:hypothetical protein